MSWTLKWFRIPEVVSALNSEVTGLTGKKPVEAIEEKVVDVKSLTTYLRLVGLKEKRLDSSKNVTYSFATGELEGGQRRATDPMRSLNVFNIKWPLWISKRNMEKCRTSGRLDILSLVTSLQERPRHWQFALQFSFAALHGQQPQTVFRAQVPLCGQETSTDPRSYLTRMANFN